MRDFAGGLVVVLIAIAVAFGLYWRNASAPGTRADGPGPNLVIEVAGEANGRIVIDLDTEIAPQHAARLMELARSGAYDNVAFHRVIDGFMAQTGDVIHGKPGADASLAGTGRSSLPDVPAEFSDVRFLRGTVGMARSASLDSANSQFFILFEPAEYLNGEYTVVGYVIEGMNVVDKIKKGNTDLNGAIEGEPDRMVRVTVE
jgi:peptidylprolyl isomerase